MKIDPSECGMGMKDKTMYQNCGVLGLETWSGGTKLVFLQFPATTSYIPKEHDVTNRWPDKVTSPEGVVEYHLDVSNTNVSLQIFDEHVRLKREIYRDGCVWDYYYDEEHNLVRDELSCKGRVYVTEYEPDGSRKPLYEK